MAIFAALVLKENFYFHFTDCLNCFFFCLFDKTVVVLSSDSFDEAKNMNTSLSVPGRTEVIGIHAFKGSVLCKIQIYNVF